MQRLLLNNTKGKNLMISGGFFKPWWKQSPKELYEHKGHGAGHKIFDLGVSWKGFISWVYNYVRYKVDIK